MDMREFERLCHQYSSVEIRTSRQITQYFDHFQEHLNDLQLELISIFGEIEYVDLLSKLSYAIDHSSQASIPNDKKTPIDELLKSAYGSLVDYALGDFTDDAYHERARRKLREAVDILSVIDSDAMAWIL